MRGADGGGLADVAPPGAAVGRLALPAILALGLALRLWGIGSDSLWLDEGFSASVARRDFLSIPEFLARSDTHPPLHYLLLHAWTGAFGDSEAALRSLSAAASLLLVPVVYAIGTRLGGRSAGITAALFTAISPVFVRYAQEARMYALLALLAGLSLLLLLRLRERRTPLRIALYTLATALMLYTHVYALFVLLAEAVYVLLRVRGEQPPGAARRRELGFWALAGGTPLLLWSPWMVALAYQTREEIDGTGANLSWLNEPGGTLLAETFGVYTGSEIGTFVLVGLAVALAVALAMTNGGLAGLVRDPRLTLPWLVLAVPIAVPFALSWVVLPIYQPKYTIPAAIGFVLLLALGTQRLPGPRLRAAAAAAVAAVFAAGSIWYLTSFDTTGWRGAVTYLEAHAHPGDAVLFDSDNMRTTVYGYYAARDDLVLLSGEKALPALGLRVWVVLAGSEDPERVTAELARRSYVGRLYRLYVGHYEDVKLLLLERPA